MDNFVAVDVETANQHPTSICSIGAVKVENGIITDSFYTLVHPYPNFYLRRFTEDIHGISRNDTDNAPLFSEIWPEFLNWIGDLPLVAHNSPFDRGCISACLRHYGLEPLGSRPFLYPCKSKDYDSAHHLRFVFIASPRLLHGNPLRQSPQCPRRRRSMCQNSNNFTINVLVIKEFNLTFVNITNPIY